VIPPDGRSERIVADRTQSGAFFGPLDRMGLAQKGPETTENSQKADASHTAAGFFQTLFKYGTLQCRHRRGSPAWGTS
jgi:hypothetical protein